MIADEYIAINLINTKVKHKVDRRKNILEITA